MAAGDANLDALDVPQYPEGYAILIQPRGIAMAGHDARGLFYALTTLAQLMDGKKALPCLSIRDWPAISVRYHHDDISRKQISTVDDFKRIIRLLSSWKINHYTPYMEDVLHLASHPDIGEGRGKLMPDEVRQIVEEGRRYNVEVFPTFSLIGHQENLLALPRYAHLGRKVFQPASSFDVRNPAVRPFLKEVIAEVCEMFPSKLFHMGFDETQGLGAEEFIEHANWCARELVARGKTPLMWVDMICNHFGYEQVKRLHPAIIPVNWQYDTKGEIPHQEGLEANGRPVWGLAAYATWCAFLPDQHAGRANYLAWTKQLAAGREWTDTGLGSSQWGDNGYENHRDLPHNAFAAFGEAAWSGPAARFEDFDERFGRAFYGADLPLVASWTHELPMALSMRPGEIWRLHRARPEELRRRVMAGKLDAKAAGRDLRKIDEALSSARKLKAPRNREHLLNYQDGLLRTRSVLQRVAAAGAGRRGNQSEILSGLASARQAYLEQWMRHNRPENIEVSLAVFDRATEYWSAPHRQEFDDGRYLPIDLDDEMNTCTLDAGGIPIGLAVLNAVPFRFAGERKTHLQLEPGKRLRLRFGATAVKDLHLVLTGPRTPDGKARAALRLTLRRGRSEVFTEDIERVGHICDWWAPFGNHMWAGGGYAYVDPMRVRPGIAAAEFYAMMELHNFGLTGAPHADVLELEVIDDKPVQIFAITLEKAVRALP